MTDTKDYLEKYDAAKDEVLASAIQLNKQTTVDAYADLLDFLLDSGHEEDGTVIDTVKEEFARTMFRIFYQEHTDKLKPAIKAMADEAALRYGLTTPVDIVGLGN